MKKEKITTELRRAARTLMAAKILNDDGPCRQEDLDDAAKRMEKSADIILRCELAVERLLKSQQ